MGLFNRMFKKGEVKKDIFSSLTIKTENVSKSLSEISTKYQIPVSNLDFDILEVESYIRLDKSSDFVRLDKQTIELIKSKNLLLNSTFDIKQSYEIKVRKYQFRDDFELIGKIKVDRLKTSAFYVVSPASILNYNDTLEFQIIEEIRKKKIKSGFFIDIELFNKQCIDDIKKLVAKIRIIGILEDDYEIELCKGVKPIKPIHLEIIEHYKKSATKNDMVKDLIYPIKVNDVILEIIKPKKGKNGRDCRGEIIKIKEFKDEEIPNFSITDDIIKRDKGEQIVYISNKNGYVYIKDGAIFIKDELEIDRISLKTGNVKGAEDSDVKLEVKEKGVFKEAIGESMTVETTELIVKGNVGNGAKIKAKILEIDGQTHKGSKIVALSAEINCHKGNLKAKNVIINRLEGGVVEADNVLVSQAISGKIRAKEIKIKTLGSHLVLVASDLIEIDVLKGSENRLIIDESIVGNKQDVVMELEEKYKKLEIQLREYNNRYKENKNIISENRYLIDKLKQKVKMNRENKIVVNPLFLQKIKRFNDFVKKTKNIEMQVKDIFKKLQIIKKELNKMQQGVFVAKIISHSGFPEYNRIEFRLIEPPIKLDYDTKDIDEYKNIFRLKDYGEMDYKIIGESE